MLRKNRRLGLVLSCLPLMLIGQGAYGVSLQLIPTSTTITVGQSVDVAVIISDLGNQSAPSLSFYDLDIDFNSSILGFTQADFGDPLLGNQLNLKNLGTSSDVSMGSGAITLFEASSDSPTDLDTLQAGNFTLATLTFQGIAEGNSDLNLSVTELLDSQFDPLTANPVVGTSISVIKAITTTPESSFKLETLGFVGLMGIFLKKFSPFK